MLRRKRLRKLNFIILFIKHFHSNILRKQYSIHLQILCGKRVLQHLLFFSFAYEFLIYACQLFHNIDSTCTSSSCTVSIPLLPYIRQVMWKLYSWLAVEEVFDGSIPTLFHHQYAVPVHLAKMNIHFLDSSRSFKPRNEIDSVKSYNLKTLQDLSITDPDD